MASIPPGTGRKQGPQVSGSQQQLRAELRIPRPNDFAAGAAKGGDKNEGGDEGGDDGGDDGDRDR